MAEWMTISQILEGAFDEVSFYYKAKRVRLNFGKFTVSICGSSTSDIFYGNFVDTFEIAIIDSSTKNFVTRNFLGGPHDVISYATVDQVEEIVNIFTGAPSPKKRVVERLTTS